eukprot:TRINITY_DN2919_c0_g1_i2.p1 TRINITY_DN2919_c0_g1~~TRINITY_DN2919_c0_g1_i2.p1  ORF type:complete len:604 (+),score=79.20 TRINITY_DN2919_c0_g1_i2:470-2281(+)
MLETMAQLLNGFQHDLGNVSVEIDELQRASISMNQSLKNRKQLTGELDQFIKQIVLDPQFIVDLCEGDINESWQKLLRILNRKIQACEFLSTQPHTQNTFSIKYMSSILEKLKWKAICRVREFLLYRVLSLRKPKTNVQIIQQSVLIKYKHSSQFLVEFAPKYALEIKNVYVETLNAIFLHYIKAYSTSLSKLQIDIATKYDLIGMQDSSFSQIRRKTFGGGNSGVFSLTVSDGKTERSSLLDNLQEAPAIVPHIAQEKGQKYPYEFLFRSLNHMFLDTVSSEYLFSREFFEGLDPSLIIHGIFANIIVFLISELELYLSNCYDVLGLYIMMTVNYHNRMKMKKRRITHLHSYLERVDSLICDRFKVVFQMNVDSVKQTLASSLSATDTRPHYITRRYTEFVASLSILYIQYPTDHEDLVKTQLEQLRNYMENLIAKLGLALPKKQRTVFLISNYDLITSILEEKRIHPAELNSFKGLHSTAVKLFVEEELMTYYEPFIQFIKHSESETNPNLAIMERLAKDFSSSFRSVIEQMSSDVINYFSNFRTGTEILSQVLTQLAMYYSRFEEVIKRSFKNANELRKDIVSISTLKFEIQKRIQHYSL